MLDINAIDFSNPIDDTTGAALRGAGWTDEQIRAVATEARALEEMRAEADRSSQRGPTDILAAQRAERTRLEDRKRALAERVKAEATWGKDCAGMLETRVGCFVMRGAALREEHDMLEQLKHAGVDIGVGPDGQPRIGIGDLTRDAQVVMQESLLGLVVYPKREIVNGLVEKHPVLLEALAGLKEELRTRILDVASKKG